MGKLCSDAPVRPRRMNKRRKKSKATKEYLYDVPENLCELIHIAAVEKVIWCQTDYATSSKVGKNNFVIRGTRGQIQAALRLITTLTREKETLIKEAQNCWLEWISDTFPDLEHLSYFLPPVFIRRVPITKKIVAGQSVYLLGEEGSQTSDNTNPANTTSAT